MAPGIKGSVMRAPLRAWFATDYQTVGVIMVGVILAALIGFLLWAIFGK